MGVIYFLQSAMLLKKRTLAGNNRKNTCHIFVSSSTWVFCKYTYLYTYIHIFIDRGTEIYVYYKHTWNPNDPCFDEKKGLVLEELTFKNRGQLGVCRSRYAQVKLMLSLGLRG